MRKQPRLKGDPMDREPDQEKATPPTSSTSGIPARPASSYRESEDFKILLKLITLRAPVDLDSEDLEEPADSPESNRQ